MTGTIIKAATALMLLLTAVMGGMVAFAGTQPLPPILAAAAVDTSSGSFTLTWYELIDVNRGLAAKMTLPEGYGYTWARDGRMAFVRSSMDGDEIYLQDGQNEPVSLTNRQSRNWSPTWSPDGRLAFVSNRSGEQQVYVMERDGTVEPLTALPGSKSMLSWSPDGRLALLADMGDSQQLTIIGMDGSFRAIPGMLNAAWSPDGRLAVMELSPVGRPDIQVIEPGGAVVAVTDDDDITDEWPAWSPDGRLAWARMDGAAAEIMVWNGAEIINISNHPENDSTPLWTPDGRLVFSSQRNGNADIYLWDGETLYNLTPRPEYDLMLGWWYPS